MTGLNLEGVETVGGETVIDLEVTSNRPDCLGHIGVAREISVIFDQKQPLAIPEAQVETVADKTADVTSVSIESDSCHQYFARVIRGVKIGPSPEWLQQRLTSVGVAVINNVVDITNFVMLECGQPLHAFDFDKLDGRKIVVRQATKGEKITAIDQKDYDLIETDCVIADASRPVAIAGVMGGLDTEIGDSTTTVLVETASFAPLSVRATARRLALFSPSSFRFERGVDRQRMDWASRRCCELILQLAGGELLDEAVVTGESAPDELPPISLRLNQIPRVMGIDISDDEVVRILSTLGLKQHGGVEDGVVQFEPPGWRRDLTREVDLIEEVARIHGYEKIPIDADIPLVSTSRTLHTRVVDRTRETLTALGFFEAITLSFVSEDQLDLFRPRPGKPLHVEHSSRRHENILRQSLVPSLLQSRRENERHGTWNAELFETASVYLSADSDVPNEQAEPRMISLVTGRSFGQTKGIIECLARRVSADAQVTASPSEIPQFVSGRGAELLLNGKPWGWLGELNREVLDKVGLRDAVNVAEVDLNVLRSVANLVPEYSPVGSFPTMQRDINFELDDAVSWQQLEEVVKESAGPLLDSVRFVDKYRGKQIAAGKKSYVIGVVFRSPERTLTAEEVDAAQKSVVAACEEKLGASQR
ncbi:UNVERIFIED_CONTAM: hypothetical protein GTU68_033540 [Idotea baltica]|nr:hypothetical protein [Idotea baltica]